MRSGVRLYTTIFFVRARTKKDLRSYLREDKSKVPNAPCGLRYQCPVKNPHKPSPNIPTAKLGYKGEKLNYALGIPKYSTGISNISHGHNQICLGYTESIKVAHRNMPVAPLKYDNSTRKQTDSRRKYDKVAIYKINTFHFQSFTSHFSVLTGHTGDLTPFTSLPPHVPNQKIHTRDAQIY
jgi:hypothetical protein